MNKNRLVILTFILLGGVSFMVANLMELQIAKGEEYRQQSEKRLTKSSTVKAARGEILDRYGRPLVTNKMVFSARIDYVYWDTQNQNEVILRLINLLEDSSVFIEETLPISKTLPLTYIDSDEKEMKTLKKYSANRKFAEDLTAEQMIINLAKYYNVDESLSLEDKRKIVGVRYEMVQRNFGTFTSFDIASDIPVELVTKLEEQHLSFPGVSIETEPVREYKTQYAAHILGRVGPIYKEEYEELKSKGYPMNATIGKDGIEKQFEEYLRGTDGLRAFANNVDGEVTNVVNSVPPQPGNNVVLTIDIKLQEAAEKSLAQNMERIREKGKTARNQVGADAKGAAAVAIDVRTGEILALANYPSYNLETFSKDYNNLVSDPLKPMFNRAISGKYPPGSIFKMVTAVAVLEEGVATTDTKITDKGIYEYYAPSYRPGCWIYHQQGKTHGTLDISGAIKHSCNYYFYETARLLGAEMIEKYSKMFGLGEKTGIELPGESKGTLAGPTQRKQAGGTWYPGDTLQQAIGQSDHQFTPLQMATYTATLANGGTRYETHLLKSVKSYDNAKTIVDNTAKVVERISVSESNIKAVQEGMGSVVNEGGTAAQVFRNYPVQVAGKTGSVQISKGSAHGVFTAYAPVDNPQIAVCVVGENAGTGGNVAPIVRDIFDSYFGTAKEMDKTLPYNTVLR